MKIHQVVTENLKPEILAKTEEAKAEGHRFGKTLEEWEAEEAAERKTLKGKIKYAWQDYIYYPIYRAVHRVMDIPDDIQAFWQRGRRGWAGRDAWGIDNYLSSFMPEMLNHMIDDEMGGVNSYPGEGTEGAENIKDWHKIIKKIAKGFEAGRLMDELGSKNYMREYKKLKKVQDEGLALFAKYYNHLWD